MSEGVEVRSFVRRHQERDEMFTVSVRLRRQRRLVSETRRRRHVHDLFHGRAVRCPVHSGERFVGKKKITIILMSFETLPPAGLLIVAKRRKTLSNNVILLLL